LATPTPIAPQAALALPAEPASVWRVSARELARNRAAVAAIVVLGLIVVACLLAPVYASDVAHVNAFDSNLSGTTIVHGKRVPVLAANHVGLGLGVTPIGPTWDIRHYFLGSDSQGRDVFARVLYGGRTSLLIGASSALICCLLAALLGIVAGYFGGPIDWVVSRVLDVIWAFPIYLLAISLSVVLLTSGIDLGIVQIGGDSLLLPILIIAFVFIPYVARPIRGQVIALREREFMLAAQGVGASDLRILRKDVIPMIAPSVVVFFPLMVALSMLAESALSFLSIGVQPPNASWGTIIQDGLGLVYTRPAVAVAPGLMIAAAAISLNIFGDGVREVLDPRAKLRGSV
jgi:peptide/nickel transport system permease protein